MDIIGIGGEKEVGKDTTAAVLVEKAGYVRRAFADPLKEMCAYAFNLSLTRLHDPLLKEKPFSVPVTVWPHNTNRLVAESERLGLLLSEEESARLHKALDGRTFNNPRYLLQYIGTEGFRQSVSDGYWLLVFNKSIDNLEKVIVTDMRFPNEREFVKKLGGRVIRVRRPGKGGNTHASENGLGEDSEYDLVLENNGSIVELHEQVMGWFNAKRERLDKSESESGTKTDYAGLVQQAVF